jgi:hypothetical protein
MFARLKWYPIHPPHPKNGQRHCHPKGISQIIKRVSLTNSLQWKTTFHWRIQWSENSYQLGTQLFEFTRVVNYKSRNVYWSRRRSDEKMNEQVDWSFWRIILTNLDFSRRPQTNWKQRRFPEWGHPELKMQSFVEIRNNPMWILWA